MRSQQSSRWNLLRFLSHPQPIGKMSIPTTSRRIACFGSFPILPPSIPIRSFRRYRRAGSSCWRCTIALIIQPSLGPRSSPGKLSPCDPIPNWGTGIKGYGHYFWRTFADGVSGTFFTEAIVPAITREDPRYYPLGHRGFFRRMGYALSRTVLIKTDSGGTSFNWSEVAGNALEAGLSNAYYPPQERGLRQTARDWGAQMESAVVNNIAKEFWPDIRHFILGHD